ncbi:MAG: RNA chaperone Hfq [Deltaproteobacteria bacterium]|nr:RNA chaperone Hfq [Candidatus Anaeroferrophillus wilburensis]MBN2888198.1 RNA chaperone Hfq [Deltaproteobacteria bacterium]
MSKQAANVQDQFLNRVRRERVRVAIQLVSGNVNEGIITSFDNFSLILNDGYASHLIYKHAIAMVSPLGDVSGALKNFGAEAGLDE